MRSQYLKAYTIAIFSILLLLILIFGIYGFAPTKIEGDPFNSPERMGYFVFLIPFGLLGVVVTAAGWKIIDKNPKLGKLRFIIVPLSITSFIIVIPPIFLVARLFFSPLANYQQEKDYLRNIQTEIQEKRPIYEFVSARIKTSQKVVAIGKPFGCNEYLLLENGIVVEEYGYPPMKTTIIASGILTEPAISEKEYTEYRAYLKTLVGKKIEIQLPSLEVFIKEYYPFRLDNVRKCFPDNVPLKVNEVALDVVPVYFIIDGTKLHSVR